MAKSIRIQLPRQVQSVNLVDQAGTPLAASTPASEPEPDSTDPLPVDATGVSAEETALVVDGLQRQLAQTCQVLDSVTAKLKAFHEQSLASHSEDIARLSIEIARKILAQKVQDRDYEIVAIVQEALNTAPAHSELTVHVHPDDLAPCQELQQTQPDSAMAQIQFLADPGVPPAECRVETPTGSVKSCISEQLEQISNALLKTE